MNPTAQTEANPAVKCRRKSAATAFGRADALWPNGEKVKEMLRSGRLEELLEMGKAARFPLMMVFLDTKCRERRSVPEALGIVGDVEAKTLLIEALSDDDKWVRWKSVEALGKIAEKNPGHNWSGAGAALENALMDKEEQWMRGHAAEALGKIGYLPAVDALIRAAREEPPKKKLKGSALRHCSVEAIRRIVEKNPSHGWSREIKAFEEFLGDADADVKWNAASAVRTAVEASPGKEWDALIPALLSNMAERSVYLRMDCAEILRLLTNARPELMTREILAAIDPEAQNACGDEELED